MPRKRPPRTRPPRKRPDDSMLEWLLARLRSVLKPPPAVFTERLPANVELDPHLISVIMSLLIDLGFAFSESLPPRIQECFLRDLAIDVISVMKVERPDVIHTLLQPKPSPPLSSLQPEPSPPLSPLQPEPSPPFSPLQPEPSPPLSFSSTHPNQTRAQFHHYIPRFILKTFADNFSLSDIEFTTDTTSPGLSGFKQGKSSKAKRKKQPRYDINVYHVEDHTTNPTNVAKAYGVKNMYRDITEDDCMKFEKLLSKHECTSATFIRRIWTDEQDLSLTRAQLADMKKFLIVMMYRSDFFRSQYFEERFDPFTEMSIHEHMQHNKISSMQAVWFENLKWLINASVEDILKEYQEAMETRPSHLIEAVLKPRKGPIYAVELEEFGDIMAHSMVCIWEAPAGAEFILSEGCFGAFEGVLGFPIHRFFVISPRFAIVLVVEKHENLRAKEGRVRVSLFGDELHVHPETIYKKGPPPKDFDPAIHSTPKDVFKFQRIVIPKEEVYKVNGIVLDGRRQCLTYKSSASMYKSLCYYDKVKENMFEVRNDYFILRRKLFSDLNRTHP